MSRETSRRDLLKLMGLSALATQAPVGELVSLMLREVFRTAHAEGNFDSKYLLIALHGAPARWVYDHHLKTKASENITPNIMCNNKYISDGSKYTQSTYDVIAAANGLLVPPIWGTTAPAAGGGSRPMADLLNHMITVRGYGTGADGHSANGAKQSNPVPGAGSVSGHVADNSSTLFKAAQYINFSSFSGYSSIKGTSMTLIHYLNGENQITSLLKPFGPRADSAAMSSLKDKYKDEIAKADAVLKAMSRKDHFDVNVVHVDHEQALNKIKDGIGNLDSRWPGLFEKYRQLILRSFQDKIHSGFNDQPVVNADHGENLDNPAGFSSNDQGVVRVMKPGEDIRDMFSAIEVNRAAAGFALAEFVFTENLVSAFELTYFQPMNLSVKTSVDTLTTSFVYDQHGTGIHNLIHMNSCLFRSVTACMLELADQLKAKGMFDKTTFHLAQEFGRLPRNSGGGSDHGFDGMITSLITGKQKNGPLVLGNIRAAGTNGAFPEAYDKCFGYKAPTSLNGSSVMLTPAHVTSTLAVLLGLPRNPWQNVASPLVAIESGNVVAKASAEII